LFPALNEINALADKETRYFVLIFDAVNEFFQENQVGAGTFLKRIDALVGRLPAQQIRVVLSCRTATWQQLDRQFGTRLFWHRYLQLDQEPFLKVGPFETEEFSALYATYRDYFQLQTPLANLPAALRDRLRNPLLLRMLAETYRGRREPIAHESLLLDIFQRYYEERVRRLPDQLFVTHLVLEMLAQRRIALSLAGLASHPQLGPDIVRDAPDSSYRRLLEEGVLSQTSADPSGAKVRFTYDQVGAYVLAQHFRAQGEDDKALLSRLVHDCQEFPMAWETARILLLLRQEQNEMALLAEMAQAADVELRELAIHALVEMHTDEPEAATEILKELLLMESLDAQRTALKAAYYIGPGTRELFLWAAVQDQPGLRRATKDILYLIWRSDPDFTFGLLQELTSRIQILNILNLRPILEFIIDLTITIFINHCERPELIQQTSDLYYELAVERLHLDRLNVKIGNSTLDQIIFSAVSGAFARPFLATFYQSEFATPEEFAGLSQADKDRLKRVLYLIDPEGDFSATAADLNVLLASDTSFFNLLAGLAVGVHAYYHFENVRPLLEQLYDGLDGNGRLWLVLSFGILLPDTPPAWTELVESFTRRLISENPEIFYREQKAFLAHFDVTLLPLGLAYGKQATGNEGPAMPYFETLICEQIAAANWQQLNRILSGLGPVGFYYPQALLATLEAAISDFNNPHLQEALVPPLSMTRLLYRDEVDIFLQQVGAGEAFKRRVAAEASVETFSRYLYRLGVHNHSIRAAHYFPRIRRHFITGGFEVLIDTADPEQFISYYTATAVRMAREAEYRLIEWTMPEE
jgi:hypothetical protein